MTLLKNGTYSVTFPSRSDYLLNAEETTVQVAREAQFDASAIDDFAIAITELFNNAIYHGNKKDPDKKIIITYQLLENGLQISVKDQGKGFRPESLKNPVAPENLLAENGRGIFLVKHLMDDLRFNITDDGTEVIIFKTKRPSLSNPQ